MKICYTFIYRRSSEAGLIQLAMNCPKPEVKLPNQYTVISRRTQCLPHHKLNHDALICIFIFGKTSLVKIASSIFNTFKQNKTSFMKRMHPKWHYYYLVFQTYSENKTK